MISIYRNMICQQLTNLRIASATTSRQRHSAVRIDLSESLLEVFENFGGGTHIKFDNIHFKTQTLFRLIKVIEKEHHFIEELSLSDCKLGDTEAYVIANHLKNLPYLTRLNLHGNSIGNDASKRLFCELAKKVHRTSLILSANHLDKEGVETLLSMYNQHPSVEINIETNGIKWAN